VKVAPKALQVSLSRWERAGVRAANIEGGPIVPFAD
jgi:hypothetical protein